MEQAVSSVKKTTASLHNHIEQERSLQEHLREVSDALLNYSASTTNTEHLKSQLEALIERLK